MAPEDFLALLTDDTCEQLVAALAPLNDKDRKALAAPLRERARTRKWDENTAAYCIAFLATSNGARPAARAVEFMSLSHPHADLAARALADRKPHWLPALPAELLKEQGGRGGYAIVRALVRQGLVPAPGTPEYAIHMVYGLTPRWSWQREEPSVLDELRADPSLIEQEVWALFQTQEAGKTLASHDRFLDTPMATTKSAPHPERTWRHALVTLAAECILPRDRLLDETLAAFFRDFAASDVTWYVTLHTALAPTLDELDARQATYGRLLTVGPGQPVSLALKVLTQLHQAKRLDAHILLSNAAAVLQRQDKGNPTGALKLLASLTSQHDAVAELATLGTEHPDRDVQERALAILQRLGRTTPASSRPAATSKTPPPTAGVSAFVPTPVAPVTSPDELALLLGRLIEEADDPVEVERALDGAVRFARQRPRHGADVLATRAQEVLSDAYVSPWSGEDVRTALAALTRVWLKKERPGPAPAGRLHKTVYERNAQGVMQRHPEVRPDWTLRSLIARHFHEVAQAVHDGGGAGLLSLPTTSDGAVAAAELNERLRKLGRTDRGLPLDIGFAALRIRPSEYRSLDLPRLHRTSKAIADGIALLSKHETEWMLVTGRSEGQYRTDVYENAAGWTDRQAVVGAPDDPVRAVLDTRDPLTLLGLQATDGEYTNRFEQVTALWPLLLPHHPELLAAHAHPRLNRAMVKNRNGIEPLLAGLGRSTQRTGAPTCSALLLGLAAKNGGERASAVDAVVELAQAGRVDGEQLGGQLAALLAAEVVIGSRVAGGLQEVSRAEPATHRPLLDCLVGLLPSLTGRRDAHQFVDVLASVAQTLGEGVPLPPDLAQLAASRSTSTLARACRRVPQHP